MRSLFQRLPSAPNNTVSHESENPLKSSRDSVPLFNVYNAPLATSQTPPMFAAVEDVMMPAQFHKTNSMTSQSLPPVPEIAAQLPSTPDSSLQEAVEKLRYVSIKQISPSIFPPPRLP